MSRIINLSEGVSLALHGMALIAGDPEAVFTVKEVADRAGVSENHLSKIMQRLVKSGILVSGRGPRGGFRPARDPRTISLLEIFESVEGKLSGGSCPLDRRSCPFPGCSFEAILHAADSRITEHFRTTMISDIAVTTPKESS